MKIGIEVQRLFRRKKFGIECSSLELIKTLREVEPNHEYIVFAKNDEDKNCLAASDSLKIKIVKGRIFADFEQFFLPLAAGRERIDILHCTGNTAPYFSPVPVVQTLHDVIFMDAIPENDSFYQRFGNLYRRKVVPLVTPRSKAVITVSQYEKERILNRLNTNPERIHVIYNGLNEKRFYFNQDPAFQRSVRHKYDLPEEYILFLGNPSYRKNAARVIQAYVQYAKQVEKPVPLVTPGLTRSYISERLKELSFHYDKGLFIAPGYIADEDLPAVYQLSKVFLFPSLSEGFGMPIVEAMACGTPVITSRISCMPEIAGDAAILTDPFNASEIADAMRRLTTEKELRLEKIEAGLINARRFSWKRSAEKILRLYEVVYQHAKNFQKEPGFFHKHVFATRD
jgi:glycosyltransferase involved in cell wall biosynthesis